MTTHGMIATIIILIFTNAGSLIAAIIGVSRLRMDVSRAHTNRRIALEAYSDDVGRYHRDLRAYLLQLAKEGVLDETRVDLARLRPPDAPRINGG